MPLNCIIQTVCLQVTRLYAEVELGYECCSPHPLGAGPGARDTSAWDFERGNTTATGSVAVQTAADTGGQGAAGLSCTAATVQVAATANAAADDTSGHASTRSGLSPVSLTPVGTEAASRWSRADTSGTLMPGESATIQIVLAVAPSCTVARSAATAIASEFAHKWPASPGEYEERWQAAFVPDDDAHFSGNWPVLATSDTELARTYYGSLMSM